MTDPREEKLKRIIEEGKESVTRSLREIQYEFSNRVDLMVKPYAVDFIVRRGRIWPFIDSTEHELTHHSTSQVLARAGIPKTFADKLIELEENGLLEENLRRLTIREAEDGILVRRINRAEDIPLVKGWLSPAYKRMDASPVFESFLERSLKKGFVPYRGLNTDYRYQISMIYPHIFNPVPNEYVLFGLSLTTGDYGNQSLEISLLLLRIVCMNLAIGYDLFRRVHLGSRFQMGADDIITISDRTRMLDTKTIASAIGDVVDSAENHVKLLEQRIRESAEQELSENERKKIFEGLGKKFKKEITEQIKTSYELPEGIEVLPAGNTLWRLSNAISLVANSVKTLDEKVDLEKEAMRLLIN